MAAPVQMANGPLPQAPNAALTSSIPSSGGGTVTVGSAAFLPAAGPFLIVVDNERIEVDSIAGTTLTILSGGRAQEGTTAATHASGASIYQVLSVNTLARHIDDRAAKGIVDYASSPTDVTLSTTAGVFVDIIIGNAVTLTVGRLYRVTVVPGAYMLIGGTGPAVNDTWKFRLHRDIGGGYVSMGRSQSMRMNVVSGGIVDLQPLVGFFSPATTGTVTFKAIGSKTAGAATLTSTISTDAGEGLIELFVEDVGPSAAALH